MMLNPNSEIYRPKSFVRRNSRQTAGQSKAFAELFSQFGLGLEEGILDPGLVFGRSAPLFLEIGFGSGQSLLSIASQRPDCDFIGIETHKPGIGALLLGIERIGLTNIRIYYQDAFLIFTHCLAKESLDGIQVFFPDPWPKRRHQPRRLIQPSFMSLALQAVKTCGSIHMATDWEDYAKQMMQVLSSQNGLCNLAGEQAFAQRSPFRPIETKFEKRAIREGRKIWDLQFTKVK